MLPVCDNDQNRVLSIRSREVVTELRMLVAYFWSSSFVSESLLSINSPRNPLRVVRGERRSCERIEKIRSFFLLRFSSSSRDCSISRVRDFSRSSSRFVSLLVACTRELMTEYTRNETTSAVSPRNHQVF